MTQQHAAEDAKQPAGPAQRRHRTRGGARAGISYYQVGCRHIALTYITLMKLATDVTQHTSIVHGHAWSIATAIFRHETTWVSAHSRLATRLQIQSASAL